MKKPKGSVLIEGVFSLSLLVFGVILNIELVRRARFEVLLHHGAFLWVRGRALGRSEAEMTRVLRRFWETALGETAAKALAHAVRTKEAAVPGGGEVKLFLRYPTFLRFPIEKEKREMMKHHFQMTKPCKFPFS